MNAVGSHLRKPAFEWFGFLGWNGLDDAKEPLDINAFGVMTLAIGRDELVGGTFCPPHESIEFGISLTKLLEVSSRILAVGEGFNGIDDAEVLFLLIIIPICAYLLVAKQLYLLWHVNRLICFVNYISPLHP